MSVPSGMIGIQSLHIPYSSYGPTSGSSHPDSPPASIKDRIANCARVLLQFPEKQHQHLAPHPRRVEAVWYQTDVPACKIKARKTSSPYLIIPPSTSTLLKSYGTSDSDDDVDRLADHLKAIRAELWALNPDPWVGRWLFLVPGLAKMPWYQRVVVPAAENGGTIIDVGCGVGGDLRRLAVDVPASKGGPTSRLIGLDSRAQHIEIGNRLFGPPPSSVEFKAADILDWMSHSASLPLGARTLVEELKRQADVVVVNMLLSEFCWEFQLRKVLASAAQLVKPGGRIVGYTLAISDGKGGVFRAPWERYSRFFHDTLSFRAMWSDFTSSSDLSGESAWTLEEVGLFDLEDIGWQRDDVAWMGDSSVPWPLHDRPLVENLRGLAFSMKRDS